MTSTWIILAVCAATANSMPAVEEDQNGALQRATITYGETSKDQSLMLVPLEWPSSSGRKPRRKNLNPARLMRKMGDDYLPDWMSSELPPDADQQEEERRATEELTSAAAQLDLPASAPPALRAWLVSAATCSTTFFWHDLGEYFWPRWIRRGRCDNAADTGCSWPPGQTCQAVEAKTLHVLRWHCRRRRRRRTGGGQKGGGGRHRCRWYKVPYPVTSNCGCVCGGRDDQ